MSVESDIKPVAWQWLDTCHFRKKIPASAMNPADWRPLYAASVARPLTDEQIQEERKKGWDGPDGFEAGVRFAEYTHGFSKGCK